MWRKEGKDVNVRVLSDERGLVALQGLLLCFDR